MGERTVQQTRNRQLYEIGLVGLGVMGRNLLLNMADHGFAVAGYDKDPGAAKALRQESKDRDIRATNDIKELIGLLLKPRAVMMLVPAGPPVDSVINVLLAHRQPGDLIMDAGKSSSETRTCASAIWRRKASNSSASACREEKKARVMDRASCRVGRKRLTSASVPCWKLSRPG